MKTAKLISVLTEAIGAITEITDLVVKGDYVTDSKGRIAHKKGSLWTHKHSLLSPSCSMFRELWDELPENLRDERGDELRSELYPHKYEDDYSGLAAIANELHAIVFKLWNDMYEAKSKFDFD